jgi:hypothetical protein
MMSARSVSASAIACFASLTDSSGVAGNWILASAMRTVSSGYRNLLESFTISDERCCRTDETK